MKGFLEENRKRDMDGSAAQEAGERGAEDGEEQTDTCQSIGGLLRITFSTATKSFICILPQQTEKVRQGEEKN